MTLAALLLVALASAQDAPEIEVPAINAQIWRPPVDGTRTLWTLDAGLMPDRYLTARAVASYVADPLVVVFDDGERLDLVSDVLQLDLTGATTVGRVRLGLDVPIYLFSDGQLVEGGTGSGDVMVDLKGSLLERGAAPVGLALDGRLLLPTATVDLPLGTNGLGCELAAVVDREVGPVLLAANLGTRLLPKLDLANTTVNDQLFLRLGAGWALLEGAGLSADLAGATTFGGGFGDRAASPLEAILGGWGRVGDALVLRGGMGTGLSEGIGAPVFRALLSVGYEPPEVRDADGDGLLDRADACPTEPEDADGWRDADGCPDPSVAVDVRLVGPDGAVLAGATGSLRGEGGGGEGIGAFSILIHPGAYQLAGRAPGHRARDVQVDVPERGPHLVELTLPPETGRVRVRVVGPDGAPVPAMVAVDGGAATQAGPEGLEVELGPGTHGLAVRAEGFASQRADAVVAADQVAEVVVRLAPARVALTREKIVILEKVFFDTAKDTIRPESFALLDEVAATLRDRPDMERVRIEGHTDERGPAGGNLDLSERRAASVRRYLVERGIDEARLTSRGFGESKPLDAAHTAAAWDKNRRVEFVIEAWAATP